MTRLKKTPIKKTAAYLKLRLRLAELEGIKDAEKNDITKTAEYLNLKPALGKVVENKEAMLALPGNAGAGLRGLRASMPAAAKWVSNLVKANPATSTMIGGIGLGGLGAGIAGYTGMGENKDKPGMNWLGGGLGALGLMHAEGFGGHALARDGFMKGHGLLNTIGTNWKLRKNFDALGKTVNAATDLPKANTEFIGKLFRESANTSLRRMNVLRAYLTQLKNTPRAVDAEKFTKAIRNVVGSAGTVPGGTIGSLGQAVRNFNVPTTATRLGRLGVAGALGLGLGGYVLPGLADNVRDWWNKKK